MPVTKNDQGTWDYECPRTAGCGANGVPFRSTGWPRKSDAEARGEEHEDQPHLPGDPPAKGAPMRDLDQFRADRGLNADATPQDA